MPKWPKIAGVPKKYTPHVLAAIAVLALVAGWAVSAFGWPLAPFTGVPVNTTTQGFDGAGWRGEARRGTAWRGLAQLGKARNYKKERCDS